MSEAGQRGCTSLAAAAATPKRSPGSSSAATHLRHALELALALLADPGQLQLEALLLVVHLVQAARGETGRFEWGGRGREGG